MTRLPVIAGLGRPARLARCDGVAGDEVENVELPPGIGEETRQVMHALQVPQAYGMPLEHDGPVVAIAAKDVFAADGTGGMSTPRTSTVVHSTRP